MAYYRTAFGIVAGLIILGFVFWHHGLQRPLPTPVAPGPVRTALQASTSTGRSLTPQTGAQVQSTTTVIWRSYSNSKFGFSIKYGCGAACQSAYPPPLITDENGDPENVFPLPTTAPEVSGGDDPMVGALIAIHAFTDVDVEQENDATSSNDNGSDGSGSNGFIWSLASMRAALLQASGSTCILEFGSTTTAQWYHQYAGATTFPCRIVTIAGLKAVETVNEPTHSTLDARRSYYFDRGGSQWLEVTEEYSWNPYDENNYDESQRLKDEKLFEDYLSGKLANPPVWVKLDVELADRVLNTLTFY